MFTPTLQLSTNSARGRAIRRADKARDQKNAALAARLYRDIIERWGSDFSILVQLGNALKDSGAYQEAEDVYISALRLNPLDADCHLQLGHLMKLCGDVPSAREYYIAAHRLDPQLTPAQEALQVLDGANVTSLSSEEYLSPLSTAIDLSASADNFPESKLDIDAQAATVLVRLVDSFRWHRD